MIEHINLRTYVKQCSKKTIRNSDPLGTNQSTVELVKDIADRGLMVKL